MGISRWGKRYDEAIERAGKRMCDFNPDKTCILVMKDGNGVCCREYDQYEPPSPADQVSQFVEEMETLEQTAASLAKSLASTLNNLDTESRRKKSVSGKRDNNDWYEAVTTTTFNSPPPLFKRFEVLAAWDMPRDGCQIEVQVRDSNKWGFFVAAEALDEHTTTSMKYFTWLKAVGVEIFEMTTRVDMSLVPQKQVDALRARGVTQGSGVTTKRKPGINAPAVVTEEDVAGAIESIRRTLDARQDQ